VSSASVNTFIQTQFVRSTDLEIGFTESERWEGHAPLLSPWPEGSPLSDVRTGARIVQADGRVEGERAGGKALTEEQ
jgi:hypothetical protein